MHKILIYIIIVSLMFGLSTNVKASHFEYEPQDPAFYNGIPGGDPEMWMYYLWNAYSIYQQADSWRWINWRADAAIRTEFGQAVAEWSTIGSQLNLDWLDWRDVNNISTNENLLEGKAGSCPGSSSLTGCLKVITWANIAPGKSNRWQKAEIYVNINDGHTWTSTSKKQALLHEIGHAYGLHERYIESPPNCNIGQDKTSSKLF